MRRLALAFALFLVLPAAAQERDQHGREHSWRGETGAYTLIDFAASWCQPCWKSLPHLQTLAKDHPRLRVLVVSVDEKVKGRDLLVERLQLTLPVLWDEKARIASHYQPPGMPATVIVDPQGKVVFTSVGFTARSWKALQEFVAKLPVQ